MKRRWIFITAISVTLAVLSLFPTGNFDERVRIAHSQNPFWNARLVPIDSPLTHALRNEGLTFHTGRGAEAHPDGVCLGDFASDEYWVVQYDPERREVDAYAWIIGIDWIGHIVAERRFSRVRKILQENL